MSFAGPKDPLIERGISATAARGIVMIAASGNAGPKSPPLYPAANANVIAVSATDAQDRLFAASNRGGHIAVAAPGVDIFLPAPDEKYQMTSGTSFSAAYVSGLVALMLERNPALKPDEVRAILMRTARDLGSPGRDDQFGAGRPMPLPRSRPSPPCRRCRWRGFRRPPPTRPRNARQVPPTRALNQPAAAMASDKSAAAPSRSPRRAINFRRRNPEPKAKKIARRFERPATLPRLLNVGAVIPPQRGCIRRERPSTPSAYMA